MSIRRYRIRRTSKRNKPQGASKTRKKTKPWKQNLLKVPELVRSRVSSFQTDTCIAGCSSQIKIEAIKNNLYEHIDLRWEGDEVTYEKVLIPPSTVGRYSRYNREGREIVYDNLPKQSKSWSIDAPNYGDISKGTHEIEFTREVYQREFFAPKLVPIKVELVGEAVREQALVFRFEVDEVLDRRSEGFWDRLLFNLNLLQENVGNHGVFSSEASLDDYLKTLYVNWELLPPGEEEETLTRILSISGDTNPQTRAKIIDRYVFLRSLRPKNFITGTNEFRRYFGAQFADDLVVFENVDYGNAIYVMFDDWEELSKKSRTELLSSKSSGFQRIRHTKTWKRRLRSLIRQEMNQRDSSL